MIGKDDHAISYYSLLKDQYSTINYKPQSFIINLQLIVDNLIGDVLN